MLLFLNISATYGRSLYALVIGLSISWWVLVALANREFGLRAVISGMTVIATLAYAMRQMRRGIGAGEL